MKKTLAVIAATALSLAACSSEPSPADKTEDGVKAALSEYVEIGVHGDRSAQDQETYCTELITAQEASYGQCTPPYQYTPNSSWRELASIETVQIDGDTATVSWYWHGKDSDTTTQTESTFYWQGERWRYQYDG